MKILLANYRYFISSGPERYMFNIMDRLGSMGHCVYPFSVHFTKNVPTPYEKYFVEAIAGRDDVYFEQHGRSLQALTRGLSRLFYSREVERAVHLLASNVAPDVAYIMCYLRKLSPSLLVGLKKLNIPIVVRLPDYGMVCPQLHCLRGQEPCTECLSGSSFASVRYRCVKGSRMISLVNFLATQFHNARGYFDLIDGFVTTNEFMRAMMVKAGYAPERLHCIPTFVDTDRFRPDPETGKGNYGIYIGRLDHPKGVHVLLEAMGHLRDAPEFQGMKMKVVGQGHDPKYVASLHELVQSRNLDGVVEMCGDSPPESIPALLQQAQFSVIPSIWYENLPNSLLESLACGTPVIASDIGSLSITIEDGVNGLLFRVGDAQHLADRMLHYLRNLELKLEMPLRSRESAISTYSPERHIAKLLQLFETVVKKGAPGSGTTVEAAAPTHARFMGS